MGVSGAGPWQDGSSRASSSDSCSLCLGDAVSPCLRACHLTVFNALSPFPQTQALAGQSRLPLAFFTLSKRSLIHHEWQTTKSPHSRHRSTPVGPPKLSTTAAKAISKLLISRNEVCVEYTRSHCYDLAVAFAAWQRIDIAGNTSSPGKGFLQPTGRSG